MKLHTFGASHTEGYHDMSFNTYKQYKEWLGVSDTKDMPPIWVEILSNKLNCDSYVNYGKGAASNAEIFFSLCNACTKIKKGDIVIINWASTLRQMWIKDNQFVSMAPANNIDDASEREIPFIREAYDIIHHKRIHPNLIWETIYYENIIDAYAEAIGFQVYYWFTDDTVIATKKEWLGEFNKDKYLIWDLIDKHYGKEIEDIISPYKPNPIHDINASEYFKNKEVYLSCIEQIKKLSRDDDKCCLTFGVVGKYGGGSIAEDTNGEVKDIYHMGESGMKIQAELFYNYIKHRQ